ncbi:META domain-containing protein [Roseovarius ramblicola]|uniref:META domain-containing protein n=1 Tax=Roseovarius ramblicola TaxID=2022336 RepID=A0ABV5HY38_9RHOB
MIRFLALGLVLCAALIPEARADETRAVTGTLTYRQKIGLPPGARAVVRAEGRFGVTLSEVTLEGDALEMPRGFVLEVPSGLSGRVRALIKVNGTPRWINEGVPFFAGEEAVTLGELFVDPVSPLAFATAFICGDMRVSVGMLGDEAVLRAEGRDIPLAQVKSASGARYDAVNEPGTSVWNKGGATVVRLSGRDLPECRKVLPPAKRPYRARGNEPGWHVALAGDTAEVVADYGEITREAPRPAPEAVPGGFRFDLSEAGARLLVEERMCHDNMSGMPYPDTAQLVLDGRVLRGCGGDPVDLLTGAAWRITALGDAALIEPERLSINFLDGGRVAGSGGCNRIVGGFSLSGEGLHFGPMASTMMACPETLMEQERRMLDSLEQVVAFDVDTRGRLILLAEDRRTVLIEAVRP